MIRLEPAGDSGTESTVLLTAGRDNLDAEAEGEEAVPGAVALIDEGRAGLAEAGMLWRLARVLEERPAIPEAGRAMRLVVSAWYKK